MNLHEYQSKRVLAAHGLPVLQGVLCYTAGEVQSAAERLPGDICVVKAQVHAGGRGKGGGVKLAKSVEDAVHAGNEILGMTLVTPQTGPEGKLVRKVYVEQGCPIQREFYLSMMVDRARKCISIIASSEGGMDIEEVAEKTPDRIATIPVHPAIGFQAFQGQLLGKKLGLNAAESRKLSSVVGKLYQAFVVRDFSLVEINPLVLTTNGDFVLLDAKCAVDDNALFRQNELAQLLDYDEVDAKDLRASKSGLSYIALDGTIGCMVNGAGLAMGTLDIITAFGGSPANFLDVGGSATRETVTEAFRILLSDDRVKGILVNIFGGIMKCDVIADGVVAAAKELAVKVPLVVRLQGTNVTEGKKILADSGLTIIAADTMADAAKKVVDAVK